MLCLSGFKLNSRWLPLIFGIFKKKEKSNDVVNDNSFNLKNEHRTV